MTIKGQPDLAVLRGTREPKATTLWPVARFRGMLLFRHPFGIGSAGVPRMSLEC